MCPNEFEHASTCACVGLCVPAAQLSQPWGALCGPVIVVVMYFFNIEGNYGERERGESPVSLGCILQISVLYLCFTLMKKYTKRKCYHCSFRKTKYSRRSVCLRDSTMCLLCGGEESPVPPQQPRGQWWYAKACRGLWGIGWLLIGYSRETKASPLLLPGSLSPGQVTMPTSIGQSLLSSPHSASLLPLFLTLAFSLSSLYS